MGNFHSKKKRAKRRKEKSFLLDGDNSSLLEGSNFDTRLDDVADDITDCDNNSITKTCTCNRQALNCGRHIVPETMGNQNSMSNVDPQSMAFYNSKVGVRLPKYYYEDSRKASQQFSSKVRPQTNGNHGNRAGRTIKGRSNEEFEIIDTPTSAELTSFDGFTHNRVKSKERLSENWEYIDREELNEVADPPPMHTTNAVRPTQLDPTGRFMGPPPAMSPRQLKMLQAETSSDDLDFSPTDPSLAKSCDQSMIANFSPTSLTEKHAQYSLESEAQTASPSDDEFTDFSMINGRDLSIYKCDTCPESNTGLNTISIPFSPDILRTTDDVFAENELKRGASIDISELQSGSDFFELSLPDNDCCAQLRTIETAIDDVMDEMKDLDSQLSRLIGQDIPRSDSVSSESSPAYRVLTRLRSRASLKSIDLPIKPQCTKCQGPCTCGINSNDTQNSQSNGTLNSVRDNSVLQNLHFQDIDDSALQKARLILNDSPLRKTPSPRSSIGYVENPLCRDETVLSGAEDDPGDVTLNRVLQNKDIQSYLQTNPSLKSILQSFYGPDICAVQSTNSDDVHATSTPYRSKPLHEINELTATADISSSTNNVAIENTSTRENVPIHPRDNTGNDDRESKTDSCDGNSRTATDDRSGGESESLPDSTACVGECHDLLAYVQREWRGDTKKADLIRQGYASIVTTHGYTQIQQVRGDHYCALRGTLYQILHHKIPVLENIGTFDKICQTLVDYSEEKYKWLKWWSFANKLKSRISHENSIQALKHCLQTFYDTVCDTTRGTDTRSAFVGQTDVRLMEAVKVLMMLHAIHLHEDNTSGADVPVFVWLMYARDTSENPQDLFHNHINTVGDSGGLEQIEMFLLGHTLGVTIRVLRPSHFGQEDFETFYPDAGVNRQITLIAEDDRHYNVVL